MGKVRSDLNENDLTCAQQSRMCELCKDNIYDGSVNTGPHNLCEGSQCDSAFDYLYEEVEEEIEENVKLLEDAFKTIE
jgi:hypothetical protein